MDELLKTLEEKLRTVIVELSRLTSSNQMLLQTQIEINQEKDILVSKQQRAIEQIEHLISKLKNIETLV